MKYLRLKKPKQITAVLKNGKRLHSDTLTLVYLPAERTAFAVCVGKKHGKSVRRNHVKRLLREAFRGYTLLRPGLVLLLPKVSEEYSYAAFKRDIGKMLEREKLADVS